MPNSLEQERSRDDSNAADLEIKDAHLIFQSVWEGLEAEVGRERLKFPREIFWLNGAPGAGKGTQTRFIMKLRYLTAPPIVISDLLDTPEMRKLKDEGQLVGDREVLAVFLRRLLDPVYQSGVVVDGFPRTGVQVVCLKLLHQKMRQLRSESLGSRDAGFPNPKFHIIVLFVDEAESVKRQLYRGRKALEAQQVARSAAEGDGDEEAAVRATDVSEESARRRYETFKKLTYESLTSLRKVFHYHFINAHGSIEDVQNNILEELQYQSSLDLDEETYDQISSLPLAQEIGVRARQELVARLNDYVRSHNSLFRRVRDLIKQKFVPIIERHGMSGLVFVNSQDVVFNNPLALAMLIDIFSERGFHAVVNVSKEEAPDRIDPESWRILTKEKKIYRFRIDFPRCDVRRGR